MPQPHKFQPVLYEKDEDLGDSFEKICNQYQGNKVLISKAFRVNYNTIDRYIERTPGARAVLEKSWTIRNTLHVALAQQTFVSFMKDRDKHPTQALAAGKYYMDNYGHLIGVAPKDQSQINTPLSGKLDDMIKQSYDDLVTEDDIKADQVSVEDIESQ